ncbi:MULTISPECIES: hypothetical protein [unclassified Pseudomonas]|uniref:hypothetical protein n=1 Tax=unclassified Pseudomonas TaxID=196821 RepID=UPI000BC5D081|nr:MULTISPECIES: hypothetical protein [unclassified Pseudomonas]PVZ19907.1 hypothetical protein F474_00498 [Pseudomonas sp. URIL14HWK12:I12]PVZ26973.1 hypothetical protein F470_00153 [Pseudomonas sp. URIL14HWK12:I10]PVZ37862.1 hypothetical protein F472_00498 [Pseudomonas sp. URIL14HWK12:I11]SNZ05370.1 hypothetical protein SAMN05660463_00906 [Pseudomonas sp. URIL14HWK12:I9]
MNPAQLKLLAAAAVALFFIALGLGGSAGYWLTARHYRPVVAEAQKQANQAGEALAGCKITAGSLEGQVGEQNLTIQSLVAEAQNREASAKAAGARARQDAEVDYQAANRIQRERTGGDPAATAAAVIDQELGL